MNEVKELQDLPVHMVGDGKEPNVFFVSVEGIIFLITTNFDIAYETWRSLPRNKENCLEDRLIGTLASVSPIEEGSKRLEVIDDTHMLRKRKITRSELRKAIGAPPDVTDIMRYEAGEMDEEETIEFFQQMIDDGTVWQLQGSYGRTAMDLIREGYCTFGPERVKDYWGNTVPSKEDEVEWI